MLADPQVTYVQWVEAVTLPGNVANLTVISPQRMSGERLGVYRNPPALGVRTFEKFEELWTSLSASTTAIAHG